VNDLSEREQLLLRQAIVVSRRSREGGNHPFGAVLADLSGNALLEAENSVVSTGDATGHAELNLVRLATTKLSTDTIAEATIYSSAEPCAMCSGAIYWSGLGRLVYAMSERDLLAQTGSHPDNPTLDLGCRTVFAAGQRDIEVIGPALALDAIAVHEGFWRDG
jgi:tRNA(Arg) A34 adenosine deaminase TadA